MGNLEKKLRTNRNTVQVKYTCTMHTCIQRKKTWRFDAFGDHQEFIRAHLNGIKAKWHKLN